MRKAEPLWRETGDGHGTTLVVTDAGLLAIGVEPVVVQTRAAIRTHAAQPPAPKPPSPRAGTKRRRDGRGDIVAGSHGPGGNLGRAEEEAWPADCR